MATSVGGFEKGLGEEVVQFSCCPSGFRCAQRASDISRRAQATSFIIFSPASKNTCTIGTVKLNSCHSLLKWRACKMCPRFLEQLPLIGGTPTGSNTQRCYVTHIRLCSTEANMCYSVREATDIGLVVKNELHFTVLGPLDQRRISLSNSWD